MRGRSEHDPSMIRDRSRQSTTRRANRDLSRAGRPFSIAKYNISRSGYLSKFHQVLRLPRKVPLDLHQVLRLPRKVTLELHQVLRLPRKVPLDLHQVVRLSRKVTLDLRQVLRLAQNVSLDSTITQQFYYLTLLLLSDSIPWLYYSAILLLDSTITRRFYYLTLLLLSDSITSLYYY